jgi:hypothetical protein
MSVQNEKEKTDPDLAPSPRPFPVSHCTLQPEAKKAAEDDMRVCVHFEDDMRVAALLSQHHAHSLPRHAQAFQQAAEERKVVMQMQALMFMWCFLIPSPLPMAHCALQENEALARAQRVSKSEHAKEATAAKAKEDETQATATQNLLTFL